MSFQALSPDLFLGHFYDKKLSQTVAFISRAVQLRERGNKCSFFRRMVERQLLNWEQISFWRCHGCTLDAKMGTNPILETPWLSAGC